MFNFGFQYFVRKRTNKKSGCQDCFWILAATGLNSNHCGKEKKFTPESVNF